MTSPLAVAEIREAVGAALPETERFLCDLIHFPSIPGKEMEAMEYVAERFGEVSDVERVPLSNSIKEDEDYADPVPGIEYEGTRLPVIVPEGKNIIFV